ncbi:MAG: undecaprenyl/decaprenyl-phosphate alpha-N-acetylglucosaminyl 1-phosphate transferase [Flammeovirgaceae bacterium]|nr:undecaprenyl/decaprenyl-phosphate alpha-N-acetylglucosaminyl 1-phosphate transferase [Flammeovirgaceae bacterium]
MFSSIKIVSLYGLFGIIELPEFLAYFITGFTIIVITNSFNLIDGLDGLAASVGLVTIGAFGFWFYLVEDYTYSLFASALIGAILAFIVYNWEPSEIFMGDTGAMIIGMILSIMVIRFLNVNYTLPLNYSFKFNASIATAAAVTIVPLSDTLRIIIVRLSKGHSPFRPDKSHMHHALMRLGFSHSKTALILGFVNLLFIAIAVSLMSYGDLIVLPVIIILATSLSLLLDRLILRKLKSPAIND